VCHRHLHSSTQSRIGSGTGNPGVSCTHTHGYGGYRLVAGREIPPTGIEIEGWRVQEGDPSHRCRNRGAWVQEGDHVLPASKSMGARVSNSGGGASLSR